MMTTIIAENIKCGGCANTIEKSLMKIEGVEHVQIIPETGSINIEGVFDENIVISRLSDLGYPALGNNSALKKAKSYVSCAIGKFGKS